MKRSTLLTVAVAGLLAAAMTTPAAAQADDPRPALVAELNEDGSAEVTARLLYDLETDSEQAAFQELRTNESVQGEVVSRFRDRMSRVADAMAADTGRDVSVSNADIALSTVDDGRTGVVELSVDWDGFAARTDDGLTVSHPFASNYEADRQVVVVGPEGYEPTTVQPSATSTDGRTLRWSADTDLGGFEVTFVDDDDDADGADASTGDESETTGAGGDTSGSGAGFGAAVALGALLAVGALARRRGA